MREDNERARKRLGLPSHPAQSEVPHHTVYHWDRIAIAAALLLALTAGAIYFGIRLAGGETTTAVAGSRTPASSLAAVSATRSAVTEPKASQSTAAPAIPQQSNSGVHQEAGARGADQSTSPSGTQPIAPVGATAPVAAPDDDAGAPAAGGIAAAASPASREDETRPASRPLSNFSVETPSPAVARARFAAAIRNKEPEGEPTSIRASEDGLVRIFFFTEVKNHKDRRLLYRWLRDGEHVATVNAGAWNNAWRSYSSKFITPAQRGNWRVELVDASGETLAAGSFEYLP